MMLFVGFLDSVASFSAHFSSVVGIEHLDILESNGSLKELGSADMRTSAVVFFKDISLGLEVRVSGMMSSTLAELQAIALAFECVPPNSSVGVYSDSQTVLDACKSELVWGHLDVIGNKHADAASLSPWYLVLCVNEHYILADENVVSGNSRHFVGLGSKVLNSSLYSDIDWFRLSLVWHPDLHMAVGFTSKFMAGVYTYFIKALHHQLPVAIWKQLYNRCYLSVLCLYYNKIKVSDHVFFCAVDDSAYCHLLNAHAAAWCFLSGHSTFSSSVSQLLFSCASNVVVCMALCKGFKAVSVFGGGKIADQKIVKFVYGLCLAFRDKVWSVYAKHHVCMEKSGMIPSDDSAMVSISGLSALLSAGVVKLLGIAEAFGVGFGFCKSCLFFSGIGNSVLVHIDV
ncbi:hypothetical protein G9A89_007661 [Geosiphon pyriformis]|nr:hypothetical protein G9A89_007661 [Geosiphon pyriformis]